MVNGRLDARRNRVVACILACLVLSFAVMVRRRAFYQEESSFVSFVMRLTTAPLHKIQVKPPLVMAALIVLALVVRRQATPLKSPATKSTCSSSITARIMSSFFPMPRFLAQLLLIVQYHCEGFWAAERLPSKRSTRFNTLYDPTRFSFKHLVRQVVPDIVKVDGFDLDVGKESVHIEQHCTSPPKV